MSEPTFIPASGPASEPASARDDNGERTTLIVAYAMYAGMLLGAVVLPVVGVIINHLKIDQSSSEFYRSHHRWLLRTFWWSLGWSAALALFATTIVLLPLTVFGGAALGLWYIYRVVRGALAFSERREMPV